MATALFPFLIASYQGWSLFPSPSNPDRFLTTPTHRIWWKWCEVVSRVGSLEGYSSHQYVWLCFCLYFSLSQSACPLNAVTMLWGSPGLIEGSCGGVSATPQRRSQMASPRDLTCEWLSLSITSVLDWSQVEQGWVSLSNCAHCSFESKRILLFVLSYWVQG